MRKYIFYLFLLRYKTINNNNMKHLILALGLVFSLAFSTITVAQDNVKEPVKKEKKACCSKAKKACETKACTSEKSACSKDKKACCKKDKKSCCKKDKKSCKSACTTKKATCKKDKASCTSKKSCNKEKVEETK